MYSLRSKELYRFYILTFIDGIARGITTFWAIFLVDLKGNIFDVALLSFLPGLTSTLMQPSWGIVTTNHSRNKQLWIVDYFIIAAHALLFIFATAPWQVILICTIMNLFAAPFGLASSLFYVSALKPEIRARFMSIYSSMGWLGVMLGSLMAGYLIQGYGYTSSFIIYSVLNVICALMVLRFKEVEQKVDNTPLEQLFKDAFTNVKKAYSELPTWLREEKDYTTYCIGIAVRGLGLAMVGPIFTIYLTENLQANSVQIGGLSALSSFVRMIATPVLGWIADMRSRKQIFLLGVLLAMIHPFLYVTRTTIGQLYPLYVMNGFFWACIESVWFAWQTDILPSKRGIYMAVLNFFNGTEWAIGPLVGSFIGEQFGFIFATGVSAVAIGLGFWRLIKAPEHFKPSDNS